MIRRKRPPRTKEQIIMANTLRQIVLNARKGDYSMGREYGYTDDSLDKLAKVRDRELEVLEEHVDAMFLDVDPKTGKVKPRLTH